MAVKRLKNFIQSHWEISNLPVRHPFIPGEKLNVEFSSLEDQASFFINFLEKAKVLHKIDHLPVLEVLFSVSLSMSFELFFQHELFKRLLRTPFDSNTYICFLLSSLRSVEFRTDLRVYSREWAKLRDKEIKFLQVAL